MTLDPTEIIRGVWFWDKRWWWVIAINELISRKLKDKPGEAVKISVREINDVLDELCGSFVKRLRVLATMSVYVSLNMNAKEIILEP